MDLVIGLGNPGRKYAHSHHNVGFDVVDILAQRNRITIAKGKCKALIGEGTIASRRVALALPQTFMNLSGESVVELINWYKPDFDRMLVVYDDVDLPFGRLRMRAKGSAGTHNGMRSIIYLLGRDDFPRLRIGIGRPPEGWDLADYVLSGYTSTQDRQIAFDAYTRAAETVELWLQSGYDKASSFANTTSETTC